MCEGHNGKNGGLQMFLCTSQYTALPSKRVSQEVF
jgi:hypothetical protein